MNTQKQKINNTKLTEGWNICIAETFEEIEAIRPIWEKVHQEEPEPKINTNIERYLSIVKSSKREVQPFIITFFHYDKPEAMVIAWINKHKVECKIGYLKLFKPSLRCLSIRYGGILGQPENEACSVIIQEFIALLKRGHVDLILLNYLHTDSHIYNLSRKVPGMLCRDYIPVIDLHWQTTILGTKEQFYQSMSRNEKRNIRRHIQQLENKASSPVEMKRYHEPAELDEFISTASKISSVTYQKTLTGGFIDSNSIRSLLTQAATKGWLRAYILYAGSEPIAFECGLLYHSTYFAEYRGFHPDWSCGSPGSILLLKVLEELSRDSNVKSYDYGFGDAPYKQRYGQNCWREASIHIFAPRLYPISVNIVRILITALNVSLKCTLQKIGIIGRVKRRWRKHLEQRALKKAKIETT
jgi:hypothetical protein